MRRLLVLAALCLAATALLCGAARHHVSPDGSGDYPTIQAAVDAAAVGDTIELAQTMMPFTGDGNRDIDFGGKDLVVRSQFGDPSSCVIDCQGSPSEPHRGFYFHSGETSASVVSHLRVVNGYVMSPVTPHDGGGGFRIDGASPTIVGCGISGCTAEGNATIGGGVSVVNGANPTLAVGVYNCSAQYGGGIGIFGAGGLLTSCGVADNTAEGVGGGLYVQSDQAVTLDRCVFRGNTAGEGGGLRFGGGGAHVATGTLLFWNTATMDAGGGGGGALLSDGTLTSCTIAYNSSAGLGGGVLCAFGNPVLTNCIIAFADDGCGLEALRPQDVATLSCCDVYGNADGDYDGVNFPDQTGQNDNISADPMFCDAAAGGFWIDLLSPCTEAHSPCGLLMGAYDVACDSPVTRASWGALKALFGR